MVSKFGTDFNAKNPKRQEKTLQKSQKAFILKKKRQMNHRQQKIQNYKSEKQSLLIASRENHVASVLANCSAATAGAFILIGAAGDDTNMATIASLLCILYILIGTYAKKDSIKHKKLSDKIQKRINHLQHQK